MKNRSRIAVVIPCYKVRQHIMDVIAGIGPEVHTIYIVDDCCPDNSGDFVLEHNSDNRVTILKHSINKGVGGAVITGYLAALKDNQDIIIKLDGDGQMDARLIPDFISPLLSGTADYTKGNRFFYLESLKGMPKIRLFGNAILSFMTKLSSGYWHLFDPTNGYTAIHRNALSHLPLEKISNRYFFETDMLFRLNTVQAIVLDIPMDAKYGDEVSNLKISQVALEFLQKNIVNMSKRIFYNYYLRDMSIASFELPFGILMLFVGIAFGISHWVHSLITNSFTSAGTVMLAGLPIIIGSQLILSFISYDIASTPNRRTRGKITFRQTSQENKVLKP
ncbi:glycosyltransferase family 2 protein [Acetobacter indonesiensis]|uniref:glycosyltransferase family 2 protein n=1 Tax=Acetobacter indonesiensis TaxID=104101 RepID=UPI0039E79FD8